MFNKSYSFDKVYVGKFTHDADFLEELNSFCVQNDIRTGWISAIGAVKSIVLGYYDQDEKKYYTLDNLKNKHLELASCMGNISIKDGKPFAHVHVVVTDEEGKSFGGHLMPGSKVFAGEFMIQALTGEDLNRNLDEVTGLPLWKD